MERENFEDSLKHAFEKAEISPSDKVWTNIELDLEKEKGGHLKKRLLFYQMLAAASVVFAMAIGGAGLYFNLNPGRPNSTNLALETPPAAEVALPGSSIEVNEHTPVAGQESAGTTPSSPENTIADHKENTNPSADHPVTNTTHAEPVRRDVSASPPKRDEVKSIQDAADDKRAFAALAPEEEAVTELPRSLDGRALPALYTPERIQLKIPSQQEPVDPVAAMLALVEQREKEVQGEQKNKKEKGGDNENLWTSIGFAAGSFNSAQSSVSSPASTAMAFAAPIVDQETKASGYSYSMGVNLGTRISGRWVFQGGVNYLTHASEYTANNVVVSGADFQQQRFHAISTNELINADATDLSNKIVYSAPYNVNNSMRYLSIPLQAGYLLVNKTFGLQLNAGVATDLFLQNTVSADSDQLDSSTQPGGSDSPYRSVNLSGLFGTEFSYRFGRHYRVALNPGIRYPFNTIYKSELGVQSTPLTFDVGLRFRYIFH